MKTNQLLTKVFASAMFAGMMLLGSSVFAQVKIGDNPTTINPSSVLDVESTNKGLLPPRLTTTQRDAITSPANGLVLYNTTDNCLQVNTGTAATPNWQCTGSGSSSPATVFSGKRDYATDLQNINIINSNQEYTIGQSDYTFTSSNGLLTVTYNAFIDNRYNSTAFYRWNHIEYRLYIDGVLATTQQFEHNSSEAVTLALTAYKQVSAGAHTIQLRAVQLAAANSDPAYPYGTQGLFTMYSNSYVANVR